MPRHKPVKIVRKPPFANNPYTSSASNVPSNVPVCVYQQRLFDESNLAYLMDLHDAIEATKVKRDACGVLEDYEGVLRYEALRNEHITDLHNLLTSMKR
jgi:hypothetical protein